MDELKRILSLRDDTRKRLLDAERQADMLRVELKIYEKVVGVLTGEAAINGHYKMTEGGRRRRGISYTWRDIFSWIGRQITAPDTEDIWHYVEANHSQVNRNTLRSQLSVYTEKRLLTREDGKYSLSPAGREAIEQDGAEDSEPPHLEQGQNEIAATSNVEVAA